MESRDSIDCRASFLGTGVQRSPAAAPSPLQGTPELPWITALSQSVIFRVFAFIPWRKWAGQGLQRALFAHSLANGLICMLKVLPPTLGVRNELPLHS